MSAIEVRELKCGMPLIVERLAGVRSVGLTWLVSGGAAREPEEKRGLSAMIEDLLLRGAGERDSRGHAEAMDTLGVSRGTSAHTFFMRLSGTMLGERVVDALPLFADMALRPRMEEESIEPVRDLCVQAIEGLKDEPQERVMMVLREKHNPSPISRSPLGTLEGLARITRKDLVEGWRGGARPRSSILAVAGAVDGAAIEKAVECAARRVGRERAAVTWKGEGVRGYHHIEEKTNQVHIALAHDAPKEGSEDAWCERVVNAALSGGMSGRLFTEVREKRGLCYSVYAVYRPDRDFGRVVAYSGTTPERAQETLGVLMGELERVNGGGARQATERRPRISDGATKGGNGTERGGWSTKSGEIDEGEFQRAVVGMKSRLVMSGESTSARASALADDWWKIGRARSLEELTAAIDRISLGQVNDYLKRRTLGKVTVVTIGPEGLRV